MIVGVSFGWCTLLSPSSQACASAKVIVVWGLRRVPCRLRVRVYTITRFLARALAFGLRGLALCFFPVSSSLWGVLIQEGSASTIPPFAHSRLSCGVPSVSGSTFLCSPSDAVAELRTLFITGDLSDVLPVDVEGRGGGEGGKGNIGGGGDGEGKDDGRFGGGGGGRDGSGGGGGSGGGSGGGGETTNIQMIGAPGTALHLIEGGTALTSWTSASSTVACGSSAKRPSLRLDENLQGMKSVILIRETSPFVLCGNGFQISQYTCK